MNDKNTIAVVRCIDCPFVGEYMGGYVCALLEHQGEDGLLRQDDGDPAPDRCPLRQGLVTVRLGVTK